MRIGMGQMRVEFGAARENLGRACEMIRRGGAARCDFVVLPECLDLGWTFPEAAALASEIPGPATGLLAEAARQAGVHVVAGLTERAGDRVYNAAVMIAPSGELLRKHRKVNELDIGRTVYATGGEVGVAATPFGPVGLNICADNFPDTLALARSMALMNARLVLSPCAWAVDANHDNGREPYGALWLGAYGTLARECGLTVVGVSNVGWLAGGPWEGRKCIGCSLAVGPAGVLAQGPYGVDAEEFLCFDLN
jgi:predicted amidohydrolase